jgi:hypothetical protein
VETILKMDKAKPGNNKYLLKVLEWKASRTPFWTTDEKNEICVSTTDTEYKLGDFDELESSGSSDDSLDDFEEDIEGTMMQPNSVSLSTEG